MCVCVFSHWTCAIDSILIKLLNMAAILPGLSLCLIHWATQKGVTSSGTLKSFSEQETKIDDDASLSLPLPLEKYPILVA